MLAVQVAEADGVVVVRPLSELTIEVGREWREHLGALDPGSRVVVDLDGVPFMDSSGLGVLVGAVRRFRLAGGDVAVACVQPPMLRLLQVSGLDQLVTVAEDTELAAQRLRA